MSSFTLVIEGDPECVDRVLHAAFREIHDIYREDDRVAETLRHGLMERWITFPALRRIAGQVVMRP